MLTGLQNRYFAVRHGYSRANDLGLIVSRFENGRRQEYGLHEIGRRQAEKTGKGVASVVRDLQRTFIVASDFSRTAETAQIVRSALADAPPVYLQPLLRERNFGSFELTSNENYAKV